MKLYQIVESLALTVRAGAAGLDADVTGGYVADMLSCTMAGAQRGDLWITLQGHLNVVAVASLNDLAGIVVVEDKPVAPDALSKADAEGIPILTTALTAYQAAGKLWALGVR